MEKERAGLICMQHPALCSEAGLQSLRQHIEEHDAGSVAIAACSPRAKAEQFDMDGHLCGTDQPAGTGGLGNGSRDMRIPSACAEDQVRMALAKLESIKENTPYIPEKISSDILVVGGGVSGLNAALEGAEAGYRVHLVEKGSRLGGYAGRIYKMLPLAGNEQELREPDVKALLSR